MKQCLLQALEVIPLHSNFWNLTINLSFEEWVTETVFLWTFHVRKVMIFSWQALSLLSKTIGHFSEESPTIGTKWIRTHITHKKLLEETWDWLWGEHNSNVNAFHHQFALDTKFGGTNWTDYWLFAFFCTNKQNDNANNRANIPFSKNFIRELKKVLICSIPHYRETLPIMPPLVFHVDLNL